ncbi:YdiU family protein [Microbacterium trichothecenolyticum]|uniref:protein adenylyltransferase SelO n=1 Tax=Microbacterium trichothecenolyticum TaxID=69370 RepID=UPI001C6E59F5|nr:YdiU family protein [Microbacterium trichothecenolyticum]MBW9120797.1 YdiU family protein [Microbacterium trichothecenolyticum]
MARETPVLERVWAEAFPELSREVAPVSTPEPRLLALNDELARDLGLDPAYLRSDAGVRFLTGESSGLSAAPVAQVYAGHQWGVYKPILGDGRAALLGERRDRAGRLRDVHLKGIGPTSMSRVDGYAVVGPMLREYLMGEAMHALGVPTTRALAVVATGAPRHHDEQVLPGAVLARTASSHVRFGSFSYAGAHGDPALLRRLADHLIARHYPRARGADHPYRALLGEIVDASAHLTAQWMRTGFVHGVLSTDNVLACAETIDYGPCAFLDAYEPGAYFSSIDRFGRYAYDKQPAIMRWNLEQLGHALSPLLADDASTVEEVAVEIIDTFDGRYRSHWAAAFRDKLGLEDRVESSVVTELTEAALNLQADHRVDFTGFWRDLAAAAEGDERPLRDRFLGPAPELDAWLNRWKALTPNSGLIRAVNPVYIARNHIVEEALDAATKGDLAPFNDLLALVHEPYTERPGGVYRRYARPAPDGAPRHRTSCGT